MTAIPLLGDRSPPPLQLAAGRVCVCACDCVSAHLGQGWWRRGAREDVPSAVPDVSVCSAPSKAAAGRQLAAAGAPRGNPLSETPHIETGAGRVGHYRTTGVGVKGEGAG